MLRLLGLEPGGPDRWGGDDHFEVGLAGVAEEMEVRLREQQDAGYSARITAGYCWPWSDPRPDGTLVDDVVIGDWRRPWNNKKDTSHRRGSGPAVLVQRPGRVRAGRLRLHRPGLRVRLVGSRDLGPDLVWRADRWVAQPGRSHDTAVKRATLAEFDRAVRNTYKVLLTRGMRGSLLLSTDRETQELLQSLLVPAQLPTPRR